MNQLKKADESVFHPSFFEGKHLEPKDERTLLSVRMERSQRLPATLDKLRSPGSFGTTENDNELSQTNTRYLFKNLYGDTLLTSLFFSKENIENLQKIIRYVVHRESKYTIDNQSYKELMIIMRSIFLEHSAHPPLIEENMSEARKEELRGQYTREVRRLNDLVVNEVVPKVLSQMQQYFDYLRDASQPPQFLEQPKNVSTAGQREYRSITQILTGGTL